MKVRQLIASLCVTFATLPTWSTTYFVKSDATGETSGRTWAAAMSFEMFSQRLANGVFVDGDRICFAGGVYRMASTEPLTIKNLSIELRGGYSPDLKVMQVPEISYPSETPTIITGDVNLDGKPSSGDARNIFYIDNSNNPLGNGDVLIEGFTLTGCYYGGTNAYEPGAVCAVLSRGVTVRHCIIEDNKCRYGGAAGVSASGSQVHLVDNVLRRNVAGDAGAAIRASRRSVNDTHYDPTVVVERCLIAENSITGTPANGNDADAAQEVLYNGIVLPSVWPPRSMSPYSYEPMTVSYLKEENIPAVIPINVGRQLFVDDFLIDTMDICVERKFYRPVKYSANPILKAETELERPSNGIPGASAKDGGIYWDETEGVFKAWYEAGWLNTMAYATSKDGITWERPSLGVGKLNQILPGYVPNSCGVIVDWDAPATERYKIYMRPPNDYSENSTGYAAVSADGIHWNNIIATGAAGDRSTMFYNPFRKKYVFSLRNGGGLSPAPNGRNRWYRECSNLLSGAKWSTGSVVYWCGADRLDEPDPEVGIAAELYNVNAIAYESVMLGMMQIFLGPQNDDCKAQGIPKRTDLKVAFSRDGFHWSRPDRQSFIPSSGGDAWDKGYVQSVGGICSVVGDWLRFYYIGFSGDTSRPGTSYGMHANGATGMALLRRDGFCSLSSYGGISHPVTTRPVAFDGSHLFVNVDSSKGEMTVEILDADGNVIPGFSADKCHPVSVNSTIHHVTFDGVDDLSALRGRAVKFRFNLHNTDLYSFWVSTSTAGESNGYVAGGGPGYATNIDREGTAAYEAAESYELSK